MNVWCPGDSSERTFERQELLQLSWHRHLYFRVNLMTFSIYFYWLKSNPICLVDTTPKQALVRSLMLILGDECFLGRLCPLCPPATLRLFHQMSHLWAHWYANPVAACLFTAHLLLCECQATK